MSFDKDLQKRSNGLCELCGAADANTAWQVPFSANNKVENNLWLCPTFLIQMENIDTADENHWHCLNESIWSELPAAKVVSWRMLHKLKNLDWTNDLLEIAYLTEEELEWAKASGDDNNPEDETKHLDCFGAVLQNGDNVVL